MSYADNKFQMKGELMKLGGSREETLLKLAAEEDEELEYIKVEIKEEEEDTLVSGDQQSMEEGERIMESKLEESSLHMDTTDGHFAGNRKTSEGDFILSPDYNTEDNDITQYSPEEKPLPHNIHHRPDQLEGSMDPSNPEESSDTSHTVTAEIHLTSQSTERSTDPSNPEESSIRHEGDPTGERSTDPSNPKESSIRHEGDPTGERSTDPSNPKESSRRHEGNHTGESSFTDTG
ncbi:uncharacterized protein ACMZJ9_015217, partial [Mantella aurantiaca]